MLANYADGRRRFDSYQTEAEALDAAAKFYLACHKRAVAKRVADVVAELLSVQE